MKRRKFIKGLLLAPAVLAVGPLLPETEILKPDQETITLNGFGDLNGLCRYSGESNSEFRERLLNEINQVFEKPEWKGFVA